MNPPEELLDEHRSLTPLRRIAVWVVLGAVVAIGLFVVTNRHGNGSGPKRTTQAAPTGEISSPAPIERYVGTGNDLELEANRGIAQFSFSLLWFGSERLDVRYDGTDVPIGLQMVRSRGDRLSLSIRPSGSAKLTLSFAVTDCRYRLARHWPLLLAARVGSERWRYVAVDPPGPGMPWQLYLRAALCHPTPAASSIPP